MPPPVLDANLYYISKDQKTVGPCTLDDLYGYIAYGSVKDSDLVRRSDASEWMPLHQLEELQGQQAQAATTHNITSRRRVARYRDYERVPHDQRAGLVMRRLIIGFLFFPPYLWQAALAIFQDRIYTQRKDAAGYLLAWPKGVQPLITLLLAANSLLWLFLLAWGWQEASPLLKELADSLGEGFKDLGR